MSNLFNFDINKVANEAIEAQLRTKMGKELSDEMDFVGAKISVNFETKEYTILDASPSLEERIKEALKGGFES